MSTTPRYRLGRDLLPVDLTAEAAFLEGRHRLRPGRVIELANVPSVHGPEHRKAMVESWTIARVGRNGPVYQGVCRWLAPSG